LELEEFGHLMEHGVSILVGNEVSSLARSLARSLAEPAGRTVGALDPSL